jgi:hypothetical protein
MWTYPHGGASFSSIKHIGNDPTNFVSDSSHLLNQSDWTYPVEVRQEAPNVPARNRRTINTSKLLAPQQAALNAVKAVKVVQNMIRRPKTSEHGAQINGPTTKPRTKPDVTVHKHVKVVTRKGFTHDVHFRAVSGEIFSDISNGCTHHTTCHSHPKDRQCTNNYISPFV